MIENFAKFHNRTKGGGLMKENIIFQKKYCLGTIRKVDKKYGTYIEIEIKEENNNKLDWDLNPVKKYYTLSISGTIGGGRNWYAGGQIDGEIRDAIDKSEFYSQDGILMSDILDLLDIWEQWHLNDLTPGTRRQMIALKSAEKAGKKFKNYEEEYKFLESINLDKDRGYRYGSKWLVRPLPKDLVERLKKNIWGFPKELRWY